MSDNARPSPRLFSYWLFHGWRCFEFGFNACYQGGNAWFAVCLGWWTWQVGLTEKGSYRTDESE